MRTKLNRTNIKTLQPKEKLYEVADIETNPFRLRVHPSGIKTFVLLYRNAQGRQRRYTIGHFPDLTPEHAREIASKKLAEVALGNDPATERKEARAAAEREKVSTLEGFLKGYAPWLETHRKDGKASIARIHSCFGAWMDKPLADITPWLVEKWRKERRDAGRAPATINRDLNALKSLLSTAVDWDIIGAHPLAKLKPAKVDQLGVVRYLSPEEEQRLRDALAARDSLATAKRDSANQWRLQRHKAPLPGLLGYTDHLTPLVLLALNTGMRRGELFNLDWRDVDLDRQSLAVRGATTKANKTRHIPLNTEAANVLRQWRSSQTGTGLVFPGKEGAPMDNVNTAWQGLMTNATITEFRFHDLRHTFASKLVMAGVDLNTVRELLGHSDIAMTLRYAHLAPAHKAAAVDVLNRPAALVEGPWPNLNNATGQS